MEYADFREGQMLDTKCCQGRNTVSISPKKLVLSNGDIEIARFEGEEVEAHYRKMSDCINVVKQRGGYNLPF